MDLATGFGLLDLIIAVLPKSPFRSVINSLGTIPYLSAINWFFPVSECLSVLTAWGVAIAGYYAYVVIARWVKLIGE